MRRAISGITDKSLVPSPSMIKMQSPGSAAARAEPGDCIFIMEGDGTSDLSVMPEMARRIYGGDDVVIASRYIRGGGYRNFPLQRTWGSNLVNLVLSVFFHVRGITDYTIFYRAYRAEAVQSALGHYGPG